MTTLQIRGKGTITLPAHLRKKYNLEKGESLNLIDVGDGSFFLVPMGKKVMKSADKVAKAVKEANVTLEELFEVLDEERKRYYQEHYVKNLKCFLITAPSLLGSSHPLARHGFF